MKKWEDILTFTAILLGLFLVNIHISKWIVRWDLTEEKRYTISDASIEILENLDEPIYVEVYLEGDLNAGFKRLQKSIRETLDEFKIYAEGNLEYHFIDPNDQPDVQTRNQFYQQLQNKGIPMTNLTDVINGERTEKVIFPGALLSYRNREESVLLLKGNKAATSDEQLNQSVEGVEYELATALKKLTVRDRKSIAFIEGHEELTSDDVQDLTSSLSEFYAVNRVQLDDQNLENYDALIVAQPKKPFTELEKFQLDQYIMQGGKAMFLIDQIQMNIDSIPIGGTYAFGYDLNIEELLFKYGVRINPDLLQDRQFPGLLEVYTGQFGDNPNIQTLPWFYYFYVNQFGSHPIVRNLDNLYIEFASSIDTVGSKNITKTPLMFTSQYSRIKKTPSQVSLDEIRRDREFSDFQEQFIPIAYLLEGSFESLYALRFPPRGVEKEIIKQSVPTKIIVVSDANMIRNNFSQRTNRPIPIDYDPYRRTSLSNKEFMLNSLSYLTDDNGLINARKKQITLRALDKKRLQDERVFWQLINLVLPVAFVIAFGITRFYLRKKNYEE